MDWLNHMFVLGLPVIEKILRPIIVYLFLVIGLRLAGKRELAQLSPFDLVVLLTISNTVQNAIIGEDNSVIGGIIGATTLLLANGVLGRLVFRFQKLENLIEGTTDFLIQDGTLNKKVLEHEAITEEELTQAAHKEGYKSLADILEASIDSSGRISFTAKEMALVESRQQALLERLDQLSKEVNLLRSDLGRINHPGAE
jgi:uncharacterized membrane protein YcaP (DUF421 family)